jgi:hypothetical protein
MDQGLNALVAAAAAFAVLCAPHPTTGFTQPVMHTSNSTATIYTLLGSIAAAAASHITPTPPRPEQGGVALPLWHTRTNMNVTDNLSGKLRRFSDYITYSSCNKSLIYITTNML